MDIEDASVIFVDSIIDVQHQLEATTNNGNIQIVPHCSDSNLRILNDTTEKSSAVWTSSATSTLLKLYESKLEMLETPKRKKRIWLAISQCLKEHNIDVSPDQVRWKINALTKKYKKCINTGTHNKFKYFKEMEHIYSKYNVDGYGYTISEMLERKNVPLKSESKAVIELRKIRLANRIESDRSQTKILIEKQWLDYLNRKEQERKQLDEIKDRNMHIRKQELDLRKREIELKQSVQLKKIQLQENNLNEILHIEKEKLELLEQLFC